MVGVYINFFPVRNLLLLLSFTSIYIVEG